MTYKDIDKKLTEIQDFEDRMAAWESDFISDIIDFFEDNGHLTVKQENKLVQIYENLI